MSYSKTVFIGRLTKDPELRQVNINGQDVSVCNITVAVDDPMQKQNSKNSTDFHQVVCWRGLAENVAKYMKKGRQVLVDGRLKNRSYNQEVQGVEVTRYVTELIAVDVQFLDSGQGTSNQQSNEQPVGANTSQNSNESDDDLPF